MKKILCLLFCLLLCGCSAGRRVSPVLSGISFSAETVCYGERFAFDTVIAADGSSVFSVTEPAALSGLVIREKGGTFSLTYQGLTDQPEDGKMPACSFARTFCGILTDIRKKKKTAVKSGGNYTVTGKSGGLDYRLTTAPSGLPLTLTAGKALSVVFDDLTVLRKN